MKCTDAIKETSVQQGFSQPVKDYEEKLLVNWRVSNMEVKEENDLLTPYGW